MKKAIILGTLICAIGMLTACKSGTANDTANNQTNTNELTWEAIDEKLAAGTLPNEAECLFILSDSTLDEGLSEGVGNSLFNLLCGNRKANKMFSNARKDFTLQEGNDNMRRLMALMSIDIALAEYEDYEEFLDDFPMFRGCSEAEDEFNWIKENGI